MQMPIEHDDVSSGARWYHEVGFGLRGRVGTHDAADKALPGERVYKRLCVQQRLGCLGGLVVPVRSVLFAGSLGWFGEGAHGCLRAILCAIVDDHHRLQEAMYRSLGPVSAIDHAASSRGVILNAQPPSSPSVIAISKFWALSDSLTTNSPVPCPPGLREKPSSKMRSLSCAGTGGPEFDINIASSSASRLIQRLPRRSPTQNNPLSTSATNTGYIVDRNATTSWDVKRSLTRSSTSALPRRVANNFEM